MNPKYKSVTGYKKVTRYKIWDSQKKIKREKILYSSRIPKACIGMETSGYSTGINCEVFKMMDLKTKDKDIGIDFNDIRCCGTIDA